MIEGMPSIIPFCNYKICGECTWVPYTFDHMTYIKNVTYDEILKTTNKIKISYYC